METWRQLISKANQSFKAGDWQDAEKRYLTAITRVEHLYKDYADNEQVLMAWLASYHNLSELYGRLGRVDAQLSHIMVPYHQLKNRLIIQADHEPIYAAILHGLSLSCKELYLYQKQQLENSEGVNLKYMHQVLH
ncbi:hypothetical protein GCM10007978_27510 [Shewanella hanedai]|jgi:hypothetical protein|uniref:Tetratricopeptide repeat protein n=1 Tax=Shewanella hanedai TaxID=25 RepID=A0A553JL90_SHEHA|nr:hypothetical protein [Shewanella hanedai]TRY13218.1 hypothetical protein FN961_16335 [Shewanella hanedai]GGI88321.1 hypothetical protein GCM10007978_27510 [Shewanella hanedai]